MSLSKYFVLMCFVAPMSVSAQTAAPPSVAELAQQLVAAEARIHDLDVSMTVTNQEYQGTTAGDFTSTVRWVFKAPFGRRFRLEQEGSKPWRGGPQSVAHLSAVLTFDGTDSWQLSRFGLTAEDAQTAGAQGRISSGMEPGVALGEGYRDMTFWRHNRALSEVVGSIPGTTVELADLDGVGQVYRVAIPSNGETGGGVVPPETIYLDPARGLAIVRVEQPTGEAGVFNSVLHVTDLVQAAPDIWLPMEGVYELGGSDNPTMRYVWQVDTLLVNMDPGEELFRIDFPAGTIVDDARTGVSFKVGFAGDSIDEAMEDQAKVAQSAVDRLAAGENAGLPVLAIENVSIMPPLPSEPRGARTSLPRWLVGMGLGLAVALASILGITAIRVRKTRPVLFCALLAMTAVGFVLAGAGTYALASESTPESRSHPAVSRAVFDCGRSVLGVLAKYYDTGWTSGDVIQHTGTTPGMSLLQIRDTARAMGLRADGVQISTTGQLSELLGGTTSAVVVATALGEGERQIGHFFCTVGATRDHFVVIDPPRPVHLMDARNMAQAIARGKGYALVVHPGAQGATGTMP